jgi:hypothetical protein
MITSFVHAGENPGAAGGTSSSRPARAGQQHAGLTNAMIQLVLQQARGQARLSQRREVHASLDHGARLLEQLPKPDHPENHFVFDHTKWIFYPATRYTWLGR